MVVSGRPFLDKTKFNQNSMMEFPNLPNNNDHDYYNNDEQSEEERSQPLLDNDEKTEQTYEGDHLLDYDKESSSSEDDGPTKFNIEFDKSKFEKNEKEKNDNTQLNCGNYREFIIKNHIEGKDYVDIDQIPPFHPSPTNTVPSSRHPSPRQNPPTLFPPYEPLPGHTAPAYPFPTPPNNSLRSPPLYEFGGIGVDLP